MMHQGRNSPKSILYSAGLFRNKCATKLVFFVFFFYLWLSLFLCYPRQWRLLKLSRKKESASLLLFFISKSPGGYAIYCRNARVQWNAKFHPGLHEGVDVSTDDFLRTKISWMHSLPNFLTQVLRCVRFPRESSAINKCIPWSILAEIGTHGWERTNPAKIFVVNSTNSFFFS